MTTEDAGRESVPETTSDGVSTVGTTDDDVEDAIDDVARAINLSTYVEQVAALRAEVLEMRQLVATVAGLDLLNNSLEHGFKSLAAQLEPLRQLVPPSTVGEVDKGTPDRIETLRASLGRVDRLSDIGKLPVPFTNVPFIGEGSPLTNSRSDHLYAQ